MEKSITAIYINLNLENETIVDPDPDSYILWKGHTLIIVRPGPKGFLDLAWINGNEGVLKIFFIQHPNRFFEPVRH